MKKLNSFFVIISFFISSILLFYNFLNVSKKEINSKYQVIFFNPDNFKITISTDKDTFYEGEEIFLKINVENISNTTDSIQANGGDIFNQFLNIYDENDKNSNLMYKLGYGDYIKLNFNKFGPHEKKEYEVQELTAYGNISEGLNDQNASIGYNSYFIAGTYFYQINYKDSFNQKEIASNKIKIIIAKPNQSEQVIFQELKKIYNLPNTGKQNIDKKISKFKEFLSQYPNCIYYQQIFKIYISLKYEFYIESDYDSIINEINTFINQNPYSSVAASLVWGLANATKNYGEGKDNARLKLNNIISNYPDTKISKAATLILNSDDLK